MAGIHINDMRNYHQVFENNKKWAETKLADDKKFFEHLSKGQEPDFFFLSCCDSRVGPELITGAQPGEFFVHRNVANQFIPGDASVEAALSYAVFVLKVKYIVVCGHYGCGGIIASIQGEYPDAMGKWLTNITDLYSNNLSELSVINDDKARLDRLIEINVKEQCEKIRNSKILIEAGDSGLNPKIFGWVYNMKTGLLKDLNVT